jgi:hypothetical protein
LISIPREKRCGPATKGTARERRRELVLEQDSQHAPQRLCGTPEQLVAYGEGA